MVIKVAIDIQILAIAVTESLGLVFFLLDLTFLRMSRRIGSKTKALENQKNPLSEEAERKCFSFKWAIKQSNRSRKILAANPILVAIPFICGITIVFVLLTLLQSIGYVMLLSFVGMAIFLDSEAFESFSYGKAITKVSLTQLNRGDQSYMKIAKEALELATVRFFIVGLVLTVAGPVISQIFDGLVYSIAMYSIVLFSTTEVAFTVSPVLASLLAMILPGVLLYLPELIGKTLLYYMRRLGFIGRMLGHRTLPKEKLESVEQFPYAPITASQTAIVIDSDEPTHGRIIISSHNTLTVLKQPSRKKNIPEE
jgi:hypothetical protein